jgi:release factor glutamine methyltransferase
MTIDAFTVRDGLTQAAQALAATSETASLDAQTLLGCVTSRPRAWLLAHPEARLDEALQVKLAAALDQLHSGTPLPYVLGEWEFFGLPFCVTPDTLIPRPETELLVETALGWLRGHPERRRAADVGTGSGCIAVSLAVHIPELTVTATDLSAAALAVARENTVRHGVAERIAFAQGDLLAPADGPFDLICANLPYIPTEALHRLPVFGREPTLALDGGPDGLAVIRRLIGQSREKLREGAGGKLLLEIEEGQGQSAAGLAEEAFAGAKVAILKDLAGKDRVLDLTPGPFL